MEVDFKYLEKIELEDEFIYVIGKQPCGLSRWLYSQAARDGGKEHSGGLQAPVSELKNSDNLAMFLAALTSECARLAHEPQ